MQSANKNDDGGGGVEWRLPTHGALSGRGLIALWGALHEVGALAAGALAADGELRAALVLESPDPSGALADRGGAMAGGLHGWVDFAAEIGARLATPAPLPDGWLALRFEPRPPEDRWMRAATAGRYAGEEAFGALHKGEHPGLLLPLLGALADVRPPDGGRVLLLGCHRGDELAAIAALRPAPQRLEVVGIDRSEGALAVARRRYPEGRWLCADVSEPPEGLGRFDLVVANNLLQSPSVDAPRLLRRLVAEQLAPAGRLLIGLPNGRFAGGEPLWGARTRNRREVDLALVVRDLAGHRRYLHQHGFQTRISGRFELYLSAWRP